MKKTKIFFLTLLPLLFFINVLYSQNLDSLNVVQIELWSSGGRGSPVFYVKFNNDGTADFYGEHNVELKGHYRAILDRKDFLEYNNLIINNNFEKLDSSYTYLIDKIADLFWTIIKVRFHDGYTKTVAEYAEEAPEPFKTLRNLLYQKVRELKWEKVEEK